MQRRKTLINGLVNTGVFKNKEEGIDLDKTLVKNFPFISSLVSSSPNRNPPKPVMNQVTRYKPSIE